VKCPCVGDEEKCPYDGDDVKCPYVGDDLSILCKYISMR
jgi:hypothetical protein